MTDPNTTEASSASAAPTTTTAAATTTTPSTNEQPAAAAAATTTQSSQSQLEAVVPADKVNLRLLLTNGKKADFLFQPTDTVLQVKQHIYAQWPKEWEQEKVESADAIRILFRGRFLEDTSKLDACPLGQTTVMHLVPKPAGAAAKDEEPKCKCFCC